MNNVYAQKVELPLGSIPTITDEGVFVVHGGSAINLFLKVPSTLTLHITVRQL